MIVVLLLIMALAVIRMIRANSTPDGEVKKEEPNFLTEAERARRARDLKVCPPHKWRHHEIFDEHGELISWKLICDICGPIDKQDTR
jgi:hypothetical protein